MSGMATTRSAARNDPAGQEITAAWIGKEKLRDALNLRARVTGSAPCERDVRSRLFAFYDWCAQNDDIPELHRLAKLEGRLAYGFRNPANQRRRVRIACTRGTRRRSRHVTTKKSRSVTGRQHDPG